MSRIPFNTESQYYYEIGSKMRAYALEQNWGQNYGFLDAFYYRSHVKNVITYRFKPLATALFDVPEKWVFDADTDQGQQNDAALHIGFLGRPLHQQPPNASVS